MPHQKLKLCKRGHKFTAKNSEWSKSYKGRPQRKCRKCAALRKRLKYRLEKNKCHLNLAQNPKPKAIF